MRKLLLGFLLCAPLTFAEGLFHIGVKGGLPLTENFTTGNGTANLSFSSDTRRYTIGPTLGLDLPLGLGFEFDALYRRFDYESNQLGTDVFVRSSTTANAWDFPLLLKFRFAPGPIKPYVSVGPTFRYVSSIDQI